VQTFPVCRLVVLGLVGFVRLGIGLWSVLGRLLPVTMKHEAVCVAVQCDGIGDSSLRGWTADHNEADEEAKRLTPRPPSS